MTAKICASILPKTIDEAAALIEKAQNQGANFVEVRLDCLTEHKRLHEITNSSKLPKIATNRALNNKGGFLGSEKRRKQLLLEAAESGFEYVDLELSVHDLKKMVGELHGMNVKTIISFHDFNRTPNLSQFGTLFEKETASGANVCKIVATAKSIEDNITALNFIHKAYRRSNIVCFLMGELGRPSRILSPLFGGFFTIASVEKRKETAAGQMTVQEMKRIYKALEL